MVRPDGLCRRCRLPRIISDEHERRCTWHPRNRTASSVALPAPVDPINARKPIEGFRVRIPGDPEGTPDRFLVKHSDGKFTFSRLDLGWTEHVFSDEGEAQRWADDFGGRIEHAEGMLLTPALLCSAWKRDGKPTATGTRHAVRCRNVATFRDPNGKDLCIECAHRYWPSLVTKAETDEI